MKNINVVVPQTSNYFNNDIVVDKSTLILAKLFLKLFLNYTDFETELFFILVKNIDLENFNNSCFSIITRQEVDDLFANFFTKDGLTKYHGDLLELLMGMSRGSEIKATKAKFKNFNLSYSGCLFSSFQVVNNDNVVVYFNKSLKNILCQLRVSQKYFVKLIEDMKALQLKRSSALYVELFEKSIGYGDFINEIMLSTKQIKEICLEEEWIRNGSIINSQFIEEYLIKLIEEINSKSNFLEIILNIDGSCYEKIDFTKNLDKYKIKYRIKDRQLNIKNNISKEIEYSKRSGKENVESLSLTEKFLDKWLNRGKEEADDHLFWIDILQKILCIEDATDRIRFQKKVFVNGHTKKIDAYIPETKSLIEQKSYGIDLDKKMLQSDGAWLTPYEQAFRYNSNLRFSERARWIITSNFKEIWIYDMEEFQPEKNIKKIHISDLVQHPHLLDFLLLNTKEGPHSA